MVDKGANQEARILFYKNDMPASEYIDLAKGWLEESFDSIFTDPDLTPRQQTVALAQTGKEFVVEVTKYVPILQACEEFATVLSKAHNSKSPNKPETEAERIARLEEETKAKMREHGTTNPPHRKLEGTNKSMTWKNQQEAFTEIEKHVNAQRYDGEDYLKALDRLMAEDETFRKGWNAARKLPNDEAIAGPRRGSYGPVQKVAKTSAYERMEKMAADLHERDPSLTKEQAFVKVYERNPELVQLHKRELRGGV